MTTEEPQEPSIPEPQAPPAPVEPPPALNPKWTGPKALTDALSRLDMSTLQDEAMKVVKSGQVSKRPRAIHVLNTLEGLKRNQMTPKDLVINSVPVIPPIFRPFSVMGTTFVPGDANELYRDLMLLRDSHNEAHAELGDAGTQDSQLALYDAVKAVYGYGEPVDPKTRQRGVSGFLKTITSTNPKFCFDAHTEILTEEHGWIPFPNLAEGDKVASYDPETGLVEWVVPTAYYHDHYEGTMIKVKYADLGGVIFEELLVTPDHKMLSYTPGSLLPNDDKAEKWVGSQTPRLITIVGDDFEAGDWEVNTLATRFDKFRGDIYCCTVPTGWLVVRRIGEGGIVSGNSTVQRKLISKTQDTVGRGVITVNPDLKLDEIGIPRNMAWSMYAPYIQRRLVQHGMSRTDALKEVVGRTDMAHKALERETKERPVIYSRSPAWHKFSAIAGHPKLIDGDAIAVNPLCTSSMNADFDGNCVTGASIIVIQIKRKLWCALPADLKQKYPLESRVGSSVVVNLPIKDLPRLENTETKDKNGASVYEVPKGIKVWSGDTDGKGARWSKVTHLTKELGCSLATMVTRGGLSVTASTNESLAVYAPGGKIIRATTASDSVGLMVPVLRVKPGVPNYAATGMVDMVPVDSTLLDSNISGSYAPIAREAALALAVNHKDQSREDVRALLRITSDITIGWDVIESVVPATTETVYDLEVPETKVFALASGLVVYDTMNVHVPSMPESVKEAYDKLMPSKMLLSDRDRDKSMYDPKHEQVLGAYMANKRPATKVHQFRTQAEAEAAVKSGRVPMWDEVQILGARL